LHRALQQAEEDYKVIVHLPEVVADVLTPTEN
jgi:hypothetical protein